MKSFAKTAEESEAGTNPENLEKDKKIEKNGSTRRDPKVVERRFPSFTKNINAYFTEYSNYTTIQGIRYVGEQSRSIFERLAWLIVFCIFLSICIKQILESYNKWDTSPILVSFDTSPTPLWEIPFPAITICPSVKTRKSQYDYTESYELFKMYPTELPKDVVLVFTAMTLICNNFYTYMPINNFTKTIRYLLATKFLMQVAPNLTETIKQCHILDYRCESSFTPILTEEGICYTYNMLNRKEIFRDIVELLDNYMGDLMDNKRKSEGWTIGGGYKKNTSLTTYPERATLTLQNPLKIKLGANRTDMDNNCKKSKGFKIILHNPAEPPDVVRNSFYVPFNQEVKIAIKPEMMTISDGLKGYDPHRRQCYFPEERYLAFYRSYTQANCEMECLTNATRKECKCVAHHMPHEDGTLICGVGHRLCVQGVQHTILKHDMALLTEGKESGHNSKLMCDCLPGCTSLNYNADVTQVELNPDKPLRNSTLVTTEVEIYFKERHFFASTKNELYYSRTDFLGNCGGLLGLFTGFSFVSIVEILYFLSLRLFCNIKKYGRHYWSGSPELVNNDNYDHHN